jgi:hypothetical protein
MRSQQKISRRGSEWIEPIATSVGAQVSVTDDAYGGTAVADEVGVQHQVCKALRRTRQESRARAGS